MNQLQSWIRKLIYIILSKVSLPLVMVVLLNSWNFRLRRWKDRGTLWRTKTTKITPCSWKCSKIRILNIRKWCRSMNESDSKLNKDKPKTTKAEEMACLIFWPHYILWERWQKLYLVNDPDESIPSPSFALGPFRLSKNLSLARLATHETYFFIFIFRFHFSIFRFAFRCLRA